MRAAAAGGRSPAASIRRDAGDLGEVWAPEIVHQDSRYHVYFSAGRSAAHRMYSANGSWSSKYCLAELRLWAGGDPTYVWDWYKSNGCLFGSYAPNMMTGWDATLYVDGPGHHTFVLERGDIATSPPSGNRFPTMYHAVAKGTPYSWSNRYWYTGTAVWWGNVTYRRANVPGPTTDLGYGLKFFE
ncbi:hypothetical protein [Dactylosporangium maewongense]|uniref:hypothetical protein n=1 Tax=Dactylosporangium maewongense TaxID=634393 RepID=UPI0031DA0A2C